MQIDNFHHTMAAHCESGAVTAQLNHAGLNISEAMVFGISGGIFFGYFNSPRMAFPTFVLRNQPSKIRKNIAKRLGVQISSQKFKDPDKAMLQLDELLARNIPVGVQVDFFYMDYIPPYARAHFNAHYINVIGKEDDSYIISDVYSPVTAPLAAATLRKARFVKGPLAPKGLIFHTDGLPENIDLPRAVIKGIKHAAFYMLKVPLPILGVRGIRHFANKVITWPKLARDIEHLSHEIMMIHVILEDRGTGGGGFRFLYATFLQEAGKLLNNSDLLGLSSEMMANGDKWREISLFVARIGKSRDLGPDKLGDLKELLLERYEVEKDLFTRLAKAIK